MCVSTFHQWDPSSLSGKPAANRAVASRPGPPSNSTVMLPSLKKQKGIFVWGVWACGVGEALTACRHIAHPFQCRKSHTRTLRPFPSQILHRLLSNQASDYAPPTMVHTTHAPAWLPSKHARASLDAKPLIDRPASKAVDVIDNRQAAFTAFVALCSTPATPPVHEQVATPSDGDNETAIIRLSTAAPSPSMLSSSWSAPPTSMAITDPLIDDAAVAESPRWDGWSFKRQGRLAEQQHAQEKEKAQESVSRSVQAWMETFWPSGLDAEQEEPVLDAAAMLVHDGERLRTWMDIFMPAGLDAEYEKSALGGECMSWLSMNAALASGNSTSTGTSASDAESDEQEAVSEDVDDDDDDDDMFIMDEHTAA